MMSKEWKWLVKEIKAGNYSEKSVKNIKRVINSIEANKAGLFNELKVAKNTLFSPRPKLGYYRTIMIDPSWAPNINLLGRSRQRYKPQSISEIIAERIDQYAAPDCHLWIWGINCMYREPENIANEWGFTFKELFIWYKMRRTLGYWTQKTNELLFLCMKGNLPRKIMGLTNDIVAKGNPKIHSYKPDEAYDRAEKISYPPRLDYFSRKIRKGWDSWGEDGMHFDSENNE